MSRRKGQPWKTRPHHRAFYKLSAAARQRAIDGFRANQPTTTVAEAIATDFGEKIPVSSLNRYREWWMSAEAPNEIAAAKAQALVVAFKDHPTPDLEKLLTDYLQVVQLNALTEAGRRADPLELAHLTVKLEKNKIERAKLDAGAAADPAKLFLDFLESLVKFIGERDQNALASLQPHLKPFAVAMKGAA